MKRLGMNPTEVEDERDLLQLWTDGFMSAAVVFLHCVVKVEGLNGNWAWALCGSWIRIPHRRVRLKRIDGALSNPGKATFSYAC